MTRVENAIATLELCRPMLVAMEARDDISAVLARIDALLKAPKPKTVPMRDDGFSDITDYDPSTKSKQPGPTMVVCFADGVVRRMTFASTEGKALNTARGLRLCVSAYRALCWQAYRPQYSFSDMRDSQSFDAWIETAIVPAIASAHVENHDGATIARIDPREANIYTAAYRKGTQTLATSGQALQLVA